jgi:hypothetical protein
MLIRKEQTFADCSFFMAPIHSMAGMPFPVIPIPSGRINAVTLRAGEA